LDRAGGSRFPRPGADGGRSRPASGGKKVWIISGISAAVLGLVVVGTLVMGTRDKKKSDPKAESGASSGGSGARASGVGPTGPADITSSSLPKSAEVVRLRKELAAMKKDYPADLTALSDADLEALVSGWGKLVDDIRQEAYDGFPEREKRDDLGTAQKYWQEARDEVERRAPPKKGAAGKDVDDKPPEIKP
jgi:hypothetical protein